MAVKTITIREDVYRVLLTIKRNNESFSDVIERLVKRKGIEDLFGALKDEITEEDVKELYEERKYAWVRA